MRKEQRSALVEFVASIPDDEVKFIGVRLTERLAGDVPIILQHLERRPEADAVLASAGSGEEVFAILGVLQELLAKEAKKRGFILTMRPLQPVD